MAVRIREDGVPDGRMRIAFERSREIVRRAHARAEAASERAARIRESLRRAKSLAAEAGATGANTVRLLQLAAEEGARVLEEKERFIAVVSHELRQPLNAAMAAARVIDADPSGNAAPRARAILDRQLRQMRVLVDDLADMSRLTFRRSDLHVEQLDLAELVRGVAESVEERAAESGLNLHVGVPAHLPVRGDGARLQQMFSNVLVNAIRYTPSPGRIEVAAVVEGGQAVVTIRDSGQGISVEHLSHIFEPFARGGEQGEQGLGIGLALVRSIAEAHGGSVAAASAGRGQGSVFTIRLPLAPEEASAREAQRVQPR